MTDETKKCPHCVDGYYQGLLTREKCTECNGTGIEQLHLNLTPLRSDPWIRELKHPNYEHAPGVKIEPRGPSLKAGDISFTITADQEKVDALRAAVYAMRGDGPSIDEVTKTQEALAPKMSAGDLPEINRKLRPRDPSLYCQSCDGVGCERCKPVPKPSELRILDNPPPAGTIKYVSTPRGVRPKFCCDGQGCAICNPVSKDQHPPFTVTIDTTDEPNVEVEYVCGYDPGSPDGDRQEQIFAWPSPVEIAYEDLQQLTSRSMPHDFKTAMRKQQRLDQLEKLILREEDSTVILVPKILSNEQRDRLRNLLENL